MAKKKIQKTNAARILDRCGISYELLTYPVDGDRTGIFMAVVPGGGELDLKAAAAASGNKRAEMVHLKEVFDLTGYVRGGCSPLGAKKAYPVYLDESALAHERICISAGQRGEQIELAPGDLVRAADAVTVKIER